MNLESLLARVENDVINPLGMSRAKNKLIGTGHIAALKALTTILPIPKPTVLTGQGSSIKLCESIRSFGLTKTLIVTDRPLYELGLLDSILSTFDKQSASYSLFADVEPDPTFGVVERGLAQFRADNCDSVLAVGGGSSIDAAKVIALAASNAVEPKRLIGVLKGRKAAVPFFCIPTTAGTGSEVTIGAVVSDQATHKKELVIDTKLVPLMAALDPSLMKGLPPFITAATGMDALTHLIESFLSTLANDESRYYSKAGIKLVFDNLPKAFKSVGGLKARENMALASFYGGLTINIAGLGYVHAFAHQIGARYKLPHGLANAKVLPYILEFNLAKCAEQLAELSDLLELTEQSASETVKATAFVDAVKDLIHSLGIDARVPELEPKDYNSIRREAFKEANATYAVPVYMSATEAKQLLIELSKGA